ncbi:MAG TPA: ComEC/Rec2 family competence protein [Campylobacterales bacterium]|nr:ComEC/Rec2 family competence protein [Campylobacterales bacterium]
MTKTFEINLFSSKRDLSLFLFICLLVLSFNIFQKHQVYTDLKQYKSQKIQATVINQYLKTKNNKTYTVFKLRSSDGYEFYTTSYKKLEDLNGYQITIKILTKNIAFIDLFKGFYTYSYDIQIYEKSSLNQTLSKKITSQHEEQFTKELFNALFLAKPISKDLRAKVSNYGISHLIAISGFHLGVLFGIFYFILSYPYTFFQDRYFPYRNKRFDLSIIVMAILFLYLYFLGFIPSLVRSYVIMVLLFILYNRFVKILSFEVLFVTVILIISFIPNFIFSIGFWFSVSGVFYIYLFLIYFKHLKPWKLAIFLNLWVFVMMIPIVHLFFDKITWLQLLSPPLSIAFIVFYPLELFLHMIGYGGVLDSIVLALLEQNPMIYHVETPIWFFLLFVIGSLYFAWKSIARSR